MLASGFDSKFDPWYGRLFRHFDVYSSGFVSSGGISEFLHSSKLSQEQLVRIINETKQDFRPIGTTLFSLVEFRTLLKLISAAQFGHAIKLDTLRTTQLPPPAMKYPAGLDPPSSMEDESVLSHGAADIDPFASLASFGRAESIDAYGLSAGYSSASSVPSHIHGMAIKDDEYPSHLVPKVKRDSMEEVSSKKESMHVRRQLSDEVIGGWGSSLDLREAPQSSSLSSEIAALKAEMTGRIERVSKDTNMNLKCRISEMESKNETEIKRLRLLVSECQKSISKSHSSTVMIKIDELSAEVHKMREKLVAMESKFKVFMQKKEAEDHTKRTMLMSEEVTPSDSAKLRARMLQSHTTWKLNKAEYGFDFLSKGHRTGSMTSMSSKSGSNIKEVIQSVSSVFSEVFVPLKQAKKKDEDGKSPSMIEKGVSVDESMESPSSEVSSALKTRTTDIGLRQSIDLSEAEKSVEMAEVETGESPTVKAIENQESGKKESSVVSTADKKRDSYSKKKQKVSEDETSAAKASAILKKTVSPLKVASVKKQPTRPAADSRVSSSSVGIKRSLSSSSSSSSSSTKMRTSTKTTTSSMSSVSSLSSSRVVPASQVGSLTKKAVSPTAHPKTVADSARSSSSARLDDFMASQLESFSMAVEFGAEWKDSPWYLSKEDRVKYEVYFKQADQNGDGRVDGKEALEYFSRTQLEKSILADLWRLVDPSSKGFLNKHEFFAMYHLTLRLAGMMKTEDIRSMIPKTLPECLTAEFIRQVGSTVPVKRDVPRTSVAAGMTADDPSLERSKSMKGGSVSVSSVTLITDDETDDWDDFAFDF